MQNWRLFFGGMAVVVVVLSAFVTAATDAPTKSGSATLTLNAVASEAGVPDERWQVQARDVTTSATVQGTVRVGGVPIERPDRVGKVDWNLTGAELSGTVSSPGGGPVVGWFKGTVSGNELKGTFTTVMNQNGSWVWEGPIPQE